MISNSTASRFQQL